MSGSRPSANRDTLIVLPAFNEAATIEGVLAGVRHAVPELDVLVIDDGSRDDTARRARAAGAVVVSHPFNLGYGAALQTGYKHAVRRRYPYIVQMDADGQHDPADARRLVAPLRAGTADVVIGSRFIERSGYRMGMARSIGRFVFQGLLSTCGGPRVTDPTSGFQALALRAFGLCCGELYPSDFPDVDVLLLLHRQGMRIVEIPVVMAPSPAGHVSMHAGARAIYYTYKMLLSVFRSALAPQLALEPPVDTGARHGGER